LLLSASDCIVIALSIFLALVIVFFLLIWFIFVCLF
jgi:hypothetical protein